MKKTCSAAAGFLSLAALLCGAPVAAEEEFVPFLGLEAGLGTFEFDEKIDQSISFPVASLIAGVAYGDFSVAANYSGSISDADVSEEDFTGDASREDFDITVSYRINEYFSVFAGYKDGETELDLTTRDEEEPASGDEYYRQDGPFIGFNAGYSFTDMGRLDFSVAYADLDADNRFFSDGDGPDEDEELEFDDINGKAGGDSDGYSVNLGWSMPMRDHLLFRTRLRYNAYEQDIDFQGTSFDGIEEETLYFTAGVVAFF